MESMHDKLDKLQTDLAAVEELYSFGAQVYPYHKIRAERSLNENEERRNNAQMLANQNLMGYTASNGFIWGLSSLFLLGVANQGSVKAFPQIFNRPAKALLFFYIGVCINLAVNVSKVSDSNFTRRNFIVNRRVAQNQHAHSIIRTCLQQLEVRRMGLTDSNPK
eukprot:403337193